MSHISTSNILILIIINVLDCVILYVQLVQLQQYVLLAMLID